MVEVFKDGMPEAASILCLYKKGHLENWPNSVYWQLTLWPVAYFC